MNGDKTNFTHIVDNIDSLIERSTLAIDEELDRLFTGNQYHDKYAPDDGRGRSEPATATTANKSKKITFDIDSDSSGPDIDDVKFSHDIQNDTQEQEINQGLQSHFVNMKTLMDESVLFFIFL